ncbi:fatty acid desaturase-domain-containing protein [Chytridium lagenaria]|nr:fatty acid desaturase-domain-containing protein [Chytridium lagenaria]
MSNFYVGDLDPSEVEKPSEFDEDLAKLKTTLVDMGVYQSNKAYYIFKLLTNFSMLALSVAILLRWPGNSVAVVTSGAVLALFWQQSGWLAHDFLHHQVFTNRVYNDIVGYLVGNIAQGFSVSWWKNKHCTHHSIPNVHAGDPDINTMPYLAWSEHALELFTDLKEADVARFMVAYQPVLYFPILALARMAWAYASILYNLNHWVPMKTKVLELTTLGLHWGLYLGFVFSTLTPLRGLLFIAVSQMTCGILLALVFSVNHNGMPVYTKKGIQKINFYELQVLTGRDVHSNPFVDWFTGGLNYQIEHHMFPMIPRHQFHRIQPLVESLCKKHGINYHKTSFWTGLTEVVSRLASIAKTASSIRPKAA